MVRAPGAVQSELGFTIALGSQLPGQQSLVLDTGKAAPPAHVTAGRSARRSGRGRFLACDSSPCSALDADHRGWRLKFPKFEDSSARVFLDSREGVFVPTGWGAT